MSSRPMMSGKPPRQSCVRAAPRSQLRWRRPCGRPTSPSPCCPIRRRSQEVVLGVGRHPRSTRRAGGVLVDMSTISPQATREMSAALARVGVAMLDAPVSGGPQGAKNATLSIMVGGDGAALEKRAPGARRDGHHRGAHGRFRRRPGDEALQPTRRRHQSAGRVRGYRARPRRGRRSRQAARSAARRLGGLLDDAESGAEDARQRRRRRLSHRPDAEGPAPRPANSPSSSARRCPATRWSPACFSKPAPMARAATATRRSIASTIACAGQERR